MEVLVALCCLVLRENSSYMFSIIAAFAEFSISGIGRRFGLSSNFSSIESRLCCMAFIHIFIYSGSGYTIPVSLSILEAVSFELAFSSSTSISGADTSTFGGATSIFGGSISTPKCFPISTRCSLLLIEIASMSSILC